MNGYHSISHDFDEIRIPVPWGHIAGKWWGDKQKQPILAVHGWQDNAGSFDGVAPILVKNNFSVLAVDLPGHGLSSDYPKGQYYYIFWDGVHILRRIVRHFKWESVTLLGHSLGGAISFLYASSFPREVDAYVSIDIASPSVRDPKDMCSRLGDSVDKFLQYDSFDHSTAPVVSRDDVIDILYNAHNKSLTKASCEIMMIRGTEKVQGSEGYRFTRDPRLKVAALGFISIEQSLEMARRITCEVLNIKAEPCESFEKREYYDLILNEIGKKSKKLERVNLQGTHHLHLNEPMGVAEAVVKFLRA